MQINDAEDLKLGQIMFEKATVLIAKKDYNEALELLNLSLSTYQKELVYNHPLIAKIYMSVAEVTLKKGNVNEAT
jgi:hypothetical protein